MSTLISDLVSVIVPVYNQERYLDKCIESIIEQDYKKIEIIIVDDGSTDSTNKIIEKWKLKDDRIRSYYKHNGGLSDARNFGIERVKGTYLLFVDSDDWIEPDMISTMLNALINKAADMVICDFFYNYPDGKEYVRNKNNKQYSDCIFNTQEIIKELLIDDGITFHAWRRLYKRELVPNDVFPKRHNYEDAFAVPILTMKCKSIVYIEKKLYHYRQNPQGISSTFSFENKLDYLQSFEHSFQLIENTYPELEKEVALSREKHAMVAWDNYSVINLKSKNEEDIILEKIIEMIDKVSPCYLNIRMCIVNYIVKLRFPKIVCRFVYRRMVMKKRMD